MNVVFLRVGLPEGNPALLRLIQPLHQFEQGGLTRAVDTDHSGNLMLGNLASDMLKHRLLTIAKGDVHQLNILKIGMCCILYGEISI